VAQLPPAALVTVVLSLEMPITAAGATTLVATGTRMLDT